MARVITSIRPMGPEDIPVVAAMERAIFPDPWSENAFREELAAGGRIYLVVEEGGAVAGYGPAAKVALDRTMKELAEMRRQAASGLVIPQAGGGGMGGMGGMPGMM